MGSDQPHYFQEEAKLADDEQQTSSQHNGDSTDNSDRTRQPTRKRSYQNWAEGSYSYGGGRSGSAGGGSRTRSTTSSSTQQPPLTAVYNSARAFINEGPSAALHELGSMGPVAVAFLAIALYQYRQTILNSARRTKDRLEDLWYYGGGPLSILFDVLGYFRSGFLIVFDAVASLRLILPMYGGIDDDDSVGGLERRHHGYDSSDEGATTGRGRGGRRRRLYERGSESSTVPDLEVVPLPGSDTSTAAQDAPGSRNESNKRKDKRPCHLCGLVHTRGGRRLVNGGYCHGIDPAFLTTSDYPSGWLVYDPIHGVLPKDIVDKKRAVAAAAAAPVAQRNEDPPEEKKDG